MRKSSDCARIALMLVSVKHERLGLRGDDGKYRLDVLLDRPGVRPAALCLDPGNAPLLSGCPLSASSQLALRESVGEVRERSRDRMEQGGVILAVLEALEAVEGDRLADRSGT